MPKRSSSLTNQIICGDAISVLQRLSENSIDCVVTSPPYWQLRDFGVSGQVGLEGSVDHYVGKLCSVFDEVKRVLKPTGTLWVNLGDTYSGKRAGLPGKCLLQAPSRFATEMIRRGWLLRNEIIWHKPNIMPQSARDRFTHDFEKIYFFAKSPTYYFARQFEPLRDPKSAAKAQRLNYLGRRKRRYGDPFVSAMNPQTLEASRKRMLRRGRNKRAVWTIPTRPFYGEHFATYPPEIARTPILAGCPPGGIVLDPFVGSGTTALVARELGRKFIGIDLNPTYVRMAQKRLAA